MRQSFPPATPLSVSYQPGDLILLYTDGLLEVTNRAGKQFGEQLASCVAGAVGTPQQIVEGILDELRRFAGDSSGFEDDVSLVCIRFKEGMTR
jgi:sigma-B regulation protein RsbU (phosphoserine phosphatase)